MDVTPPVRHGGTEEREQPSMLPASSPGQQGDPRSHLLAFGGRQQGRALAPTAAGPARPVQGGYPDSRVGLRVLPGRRKTPRRGRGGIMVAAISPSMQSDGGERATPNQRQTRARRLCPRCRCGSQLPPTRHRRHRASARGCGAPRDATDVVNSFNNSY